VDHADKLRQLSGKGAFNPQPALELANRLVDAIDRSAEMSSTECGLLQAAGEYFLLVDDAEHDLTSRSGFEDDRQVVDAVLHVVQSRSS
jgi:hypothetical protein